MVSLWSSSEQRVQRTGRGSTTGQEALLIFTYEGHMPYSKEAREHAKKNKLALFAVEIDGRPSQDGVTGKYVSDGPMDVRLARALWFFCFELTKAKARPSVAFKKWFPGGMPRKIEPAKQLRKP